MRVRIGYVILLVALCPHAFPSSLKFVFYHYYVTKLALQNFLHNQNPEILEFWKPWGDQTTVIKENIILPIVIGGIKCSTFAY